MVAAGSLLGVMLAPLLAPCPPLVSFASLASISFMVASTVLGLLIGSAQAPSVKAILHPVITCALTAQTGAAILAGVTGASFTGTLKAYLTKNPQAMGGGDVLMNFLGVVILSFGFRVFGQRELMKRHSAEIFGSTFASAGG